MRPLIQIIGRMFTTITLICAFITLGFAHKDIPTPMTAELAAFIAVGGSMSDICADDHQPEHGQAVHCEACRIADDFVIFQTCTHTAFAELENVQIWAFIAKHLSQSQGLDPTRLTRAPTYV